MQYLIGGRPKLGQKQCLAGVLRQELQGTYDNWSTRDRHHISFSDKSHSVDIMI